MQYLAAALSAPGTPALVSVLKTSILPKIPEPVLKHQSAKILDRLVYLLAQVSEDESALLDVLSCVAMLASVTPVGRAPPTLAQVLMCATDPRAKVSSAAVATLSRFPQPWSAAPRHDLYTAVVRDMSVCPALLVAAAPLLSLSQCARVFEAAVQVWVTRHRATTSSVDNLRASALENSRFTEFTAAVMDFVAGVFAAPQLNDETAWRMWVLVRDMGATAPQHPAYLRALVSGVRALSSAVQGPAAIAEAVKAVTSALFAGGKMRFKDQQQCYASLKLLMDMPLASDTQLRDSALLMVKHLDQSDPLALDYLVWVVGAAGARSDPVEPYTPVVLVCLLRCEDQAQWLAVLGAAMAAFSVVSVLTLVGALLRDGRAPALAPHLRGWLLECARKHVACDRLDGFARVMASRGSLFQGVDEDQLWATLPAFAVSGAGVSSPEELGADLASIAAKVQQCRSLEGALALCRALQALEQVQADLGRQGEAAVAGLLDWLVTVLEHAGEAELPTLAAGVRIAAGLGDAAAANLRFQAVLRALLLVQADDQSLEAQRGLETCLALLPALTDDHVVQLYRTLLEELDNDALQKKAFKVLARLVDTRYAVLQGAEGVHVYPDIDRVEVRSAGARRSKLVLLDSLVRQQPAGSSSELDQRMVVEVILAIKESSEKTRELGWAMLRSLATKYLDSAEPVELIRLLAAGLGGSPHIQSGSIACLSAVVGEFSGRLDMALLGQMVDTMILLVARVKAREVVYAALGFFKALIGLSDTDILEPRLQRIVDALAVWTSADKNNRYREKIRYTFEKLIKRFGVDRVRQHILASEVCKDLKFVDSIWKELRKSKKRKEAPGAGETGPTKHHHI